jgi:hypothetical protein
VSKTAPFLFDSAHLEVLAVCSRLFPAQPSKHMVAFSCQARQLSEIHQLQSSSTELVSQLVDVS